MVVADANDGADEPEDDRDSTSRSPSSGSGTDGAESARQRGAFGGGAGSGSSSDQDDSTSGTTGGSSDSAESAQQRGAFGGGAGSGSSTDDGEQSDGGSTSGVGTSGAESARQRGAFGSGSESGSSSDQGDSTSRSSSGGMDDGQNVLKQAAFGDEGSGSGTGADPASMTNPGLGGFQGGATAPEFNPVPDDVKDLPGYGTQFDRDEVRAFQREFAKTHNLPVSATRLDVRNGKLVVVPTQAGRRELAAREFASTQEGVDREDIELIPSGENRYSIEFVDPDAAPERETPGRDALLRGAFGDPEEIARDSFLASNAGSAYRALFRGSLGDSPQEQAQEQRQALIERNQAVIDTIKRGALGSRTGRTRRGHIRGGAGGFLRGGFGDPEQIIEDQIENPVVDVEVTQRGTEFDVRRRDRYDIDWSFGLGDPEKDEVESALRGFGEWAAPGVRQWVGPVGEAIPGREGKLWGEFGGRDGVLVNTVSNIPRWPAQLLEVSETGAHLAGPALRAPSAVLALRDPELEKLQARSQQAAAGTTFLAGEAVDFARANPQRAVGNVGLGFAGAGYTAASLARAGVLSRLANMDFGDFRAGGRSPIEVGIRRGDPDAGLVDVNVNPRAVRSAREAPRRVVQSLRDKTFRVDVGKPSTTPTRTLAGESTDVSSAQFAAERSASGRVSAQLLDDPESGLVDVNVNRRRRNLAAGFRDLASRARNLRGKTLRVDVGEPSATPTRTLAGESTGVSAAQFASERAASGRFTAQLLDDPDAGLLDFNVNLGRQRLADGFGAVAARARGLRDKTLRVDVGNPSATPTRTFGGDSTGITPAQFAAERAASGRFTAQLLDDPDTGLLDFNVNVSRRRLADRFGAVASRARGLRNKTLRVDVGEPTATPTRTLVGESTSVSAAQFAAERAASGRVSAQLLDDPDAGLLDVNINSRPTLEGARGRTSGLAADIQNTLASLNAVNAVRSTEQPLRTALVAPFVAGDRLSQAARGTSVSGLLGSARRRGTDALGGLRGYTLQIDVGKPRGGYRALDEPIDADDYDLVVVDTDADADLVDVDSDPDGDTVTATGDQEVTATGSRGQAVAFKTRTGDVDVDAESTAGSASGPLARPSVATLPGLGLAGGAGGLGGVADVGGIGGLARGGRPIGFGGRSVQSPGMSSGLAGAQQPALAADLHARQQAFLDRAVPTGLGFSVSGMTAPLPGVHVTPGIREFAGTPPSHTPDFGFPGDPSGPPRSPSDDDRDDDSAASQTSMPARPSGSVPASSDPFAAGWFAETVAAIANPGLGPRRPASQQSLEDVPEANFLTGELPTAAFVSGTAAEQERIQDTLALLGAGDSGSDANDSSSTEEDWLAV